MDIFSWFDEISDAEFAEVISGLNTVEAKIVFLLMLSPDERQSKFKMGNKFEGFANEIEQMAVNFPSALTPANPIDTYKSKRRQYNQLTQISSLAASVYQRCEDTRLQLGSEILACANIYYNSFKRLSKTDIAMKQAMDILATTYKKSPPALPVIHTIAPSGTLTIKGVVTRTQLVNKGTAVISVKAGNELASKLKDPALVIDPSSSDKIPAGWTSIEVTNLSASNAATISVRMK